MEGVLIVCLFSVITCSRQAEGFQPHDAPPFARMTNNENQQGVVTDNGVDTAQQNGTSYSHSKPINPRAQQPHKNVGPRHLENRSTQSESKPHANTIFNKNSSNDEDKDESKKNQELSDQKAKASSTNDSPNTIKLRAEFTNSYVNRRDDTNIASVSRKSHYPLAKDMSTDLQAKVNGCVFTGGGNLNIGSVFSE